jgi:hypothetical protein
MHLTIWSKHIPATTHHHLQQRVHHWHKTRIFAPATNHHSCKSPHEPKPYSTAKTLIVIVIVVSGFVLVFAGKVMARVAEPSCSRIIALFGDELAAGGFYAWVLLQVPLRQQVNVGINKVHLHAAANVCDGL